MTAVDAPFASVNDLRDRLGAHAYLADRGLATAIHLALSLGKPLLLEGEAMECLGRLAHRVVWVNPLKGSPRYEPLARGMAAAMPSVDVFLSGHKLESLSEPS